MKNKVLGGLTESKIKRQRSKSQIKMQKDEASPMLKLGFYDPPPGRLAMCIAGLSWPALVEPFLTFDLSFCILVLDV
ncbi:MAG: hypothetical protein HY673_24775 [Chloroflexi bacterium]|nr:hypothetical protein [Chloroflexota bacterium]